MNNYSLVLATKSLKKRYKKVLPLLIIIFLMTLLIVFISHLINTYTDYTLNNNKIKYGTWRYLYTDIESLEDKYISDSEHKYYLAYIVDQIEKDGFTSKVYSLEDGLEKILPINIVEGRLPKQEGELALTESSLITFGIKEELNIPVLINNQTYTITGIIQDYPKDLIILYDIPQLITYKSAGNKADIYMTNLDREMLNTYPYTHFYNTHINDIEFLFSNTYAILLVLMIGMVCITAINYTLMNERVEEFNLLRGIGTTSYQLNLMIIFECFVICLVTLPVALMIGEILAFIVLDYLTIYLNLNYYQFDMQAILLNGLYVFSVTLLGTYIPYNSARFYSLAGNFQSKPKFFIPIPSKRVNLFKIAFKMLTSKKFSFIFFVGLVAVYFYYFLGTIESAILYKNYQETYTEMRDDYILTYSGDWMTSLLSPEKVEFYEEVTNQKTALFNLISSGWTSNYRENGDIIWNSISEEELDNYSKTLCMVISNQQAKDYVESLLVEGRLPISDHEVVVYLPGRNNLDNAVLTLDNYYFTMQDKTLNVGDSIRYKMLKTDGFKEFVVSGIITHEPYDYLFNSSLTFLFNKPIYESLEDSYSTMMIDFDNKEDYEKYTNFLVADTKMSFNINQSITSLIENMDMYKQEFYINSIIVGFLSIGLLGLFYFINKYQVDDNKKMIGLLKASGASHKDIYKIYVIQSLIICFVGIICSHFFLIYELFNEQSYIYHIYPFELHFVLTGMIVVLITFVYCIPLRRIRKYNPLELISFRE